jgi:N-acetylneuraminate synthase
MQTPRVIAEIGCNHKGDMDIAKELILTAKTFCKVDAVKFQKRDIETWTKKDPDLYNGSHPNPHNSYGDTYKEHREALEFTPKQHKELMKYCEEVEIEYSTSVWDLPSAKEITKLNPKMIKIPSACSNHWEMLEWLCENYEGEIHVSTGMTTSKELDKLIDLFKKHKRNKDLVLYYCVSGYPVPFEDLHLLEIKNFIKNYGKIVKEIAFSGHHLGIAMDVVAYTLGATTIERHYTLDRTWKGTDHAASLEPDGLRRVKRDLMATQKALTYKEKEILGIEEAQRKKLKWNK